MKFIILLMCLSSFMYSEDKVNTQKSIEQLFDFEVITKPYAKIYFSKTLESEKQEILKKVEESMLQIRRGLRYENFAGTVNFNPDDIYKTLGFDSTEDIKEMGEMIINHFGMEPLITMPKSTEFPIYIMGSKEIKKVLRSGHKLPNLSYDKENDQFSYVKMMQTSWKKGGEIQKQRASDMVLIYEQVGDEPFRVIDLLLEGHVFLADGASRSFVALHELIEMLILVKFKSQTAHVRWFTDGFASALAEHYADKFGLKRDPFTQESLNPKLYTEECKREINLRYWPSVPYEYKTSLEGEGEISNARYAMSLYEAKRFIGKCGLEKFTTLMNALTKEKEITCDTIVMAMLEHCYYDMDSRLDLYQTETRVSALIDKYKKEIVSGDPVAKARAMIRMNEVRLGYGYEYGDYVNIAFATARAGSVESAISLLQSQEKKISLRGNPELMNKLVGDLLYLAVGFKGEYLTTKNLKLFNNFYNNNAHVEFIKCYDLLNRGFFRAAYYKAEDLWVHVKDSKKEDVLLKRIEEFLKSTLKKHPQIISLPLLLPDMSNELERLKKRIKNGDKYAGFTYGMEMYVRKEKSAIEHLSRLADSGLRDAQEVLAKFYCFGLGVEKNHQKSLHYAHLALNQVSPDMFMIVYFNLLEHDISNLRKKDYLIKAVQENDKKGLLLNAVDFKEKGDMNRFIQGCLRAASYGNDRALFILFSYFYNQPQKHPQVYNWLRWAAEKGHEEAIKTAKILNIELHKK